MNLYIFSMSLRREDYSEFPGKFEGWMQNSISVQQPSRRLEEKVPGQKRRWLPPEFPPSTKRSEELKKT